MICQWAGKWRTFRIFQAVAVTVDSIDLQICLIASAIRFEFAIVFEFDSSNESQRKQLRMEVSNA